MDGSFQARGTISCGMLKGLAVNVVDSLSSDRQLVRVSGMAGVFIDIAFDWVEVEESWPSPDRAASETTLAVVPSVAQEEKIAPKKDDLS
jgi:hypothetical protein